MPEASPSALVRSSQFSKDTRERFRHKAPCSGVSYGCWCVASAPPPPGLADARVRRLESLSVQRFLRSRGSNTMRLATGKTVLIVEPDSDARSQLQSVFDAAGYKVVATASGDDALSAVANRDISLVVTEMYLDNRKGSCLLNAICDPAPDRHARVLAYTSHGLKKD